MENIVIAIITVCVPSITTLITSHYAKKRQERHMAKQSIFQLIVEDKIRVLEGKIPENYQEVLMEYDTYSKDGGNSYVKEKVETYQKWYKSVNKQK